MQEFSPPARTTPFGMAPLPHEDEPMVVQIFARITVL